MLRPAQRMRAIFAQGFRCSKQRPGPERGKSASCQLLPDLHHIDVTHCFCSFFPFRVKSVQGEEKWRKRLMQLKRPLNQILASAALLAAASLHAQPEVRVDYRFYTVSPQTYADLKAELDANSPIRMGDRVAHGHTRINLQWRPIMTPS